MSIRPVVTLASLLLLAGGWLAPLPAAAAVTTGQCSTATGVTLVVDFQGLGGGRVVRCVEGVPRGTTGLGLLRLAGVSAEGTIHDGPGFVCRLNGRPGPNETLAIDGDPDYRESCIETPPSSAFWSYWHADNGGSWTYSQLGGANRQVERGGYEGWSFSLNKADGSNPPPGIKPSHEIVEAKPEATPSPTPKPTPKPTPTPTPKPPAPTTAPADDSKPVAPPRTTAPGSTSRPSTTAPVTPAPPKDDPVESSAAAEPEPTTPTPTPTQPDPSAGTPTSTDPTSTADATQSPAPSVTATLPPEDGVPVGTIVGVGVVATLGLGGGLAWWRRRSV